MNAIIGHKKIFDFFEKVIATGNLSHAYCLVGSEKLGKRTMVEQISAKILGVSVDKLRQQPDFIVLEQERNKKTNETNKNIHAEQVRDLCVFLTQRSFLGGYKIALIDKAEKMNTHSANILLKTLEEPRGKAVLFLVTKDDALLPKTIISRCQMIYFHPVEKNEIKNFIESQGIGLKQAEEMARLSVGLPGRVCEWVEKKEVYEAYKKEMLRFMSLINKPFYEKLEKVEDLFGDKSDHIAARDNLQNILDIWQAVLRGFLHSNNGILEKRVKLDITDKKLVNLSKLIQATKDNLLVNIHPRLAVEQILLEIP